MPNSIGCWHGRAIQPVASALVLSSELQQLDFFMLATAALITRALYR
jgi:hypothetical protein